MKRTYKRILCMLLALLLCISHTSLTAHADGEPETEAVAAPEITEAEPAELKAPKTEIVTEPEITEAEPAELKALETENVTGLEITEVEPAELKASEAENVKAPAGSGTRDANAFTTQPVGGSFSPESLQFWMHWVTNFVPVRYEIRKQIFSDETERIANVTDEDLLAEEAAYWIEGENGPGEYYVRVFYGSGSDDYVESDHITVTDHALQFDSQPGSTVYIDPDTRQYAISWELNFDPDVVTIERYVNGHWYERVTSVSGQRSGTYCLPSKTERGSSYRIYAYYYYHSDPTGEEGNGEYIVSQLFTLSAANLHFESVPPTVVSIDPDTLQFTINWELNFTPEMLVISQWFHGEFVKRVVTMVGQDHSGSFPLSASLDLNCTYCLEAFYYFEEKPGEDLSEGNGYDGYSVESSFTLSAGTLHFNSQPTSVVQIDPVNLNYAISWDLNFDPEVITIERYVNGHWDDRVVSLDGQSSGTYPLPAKSDQSATYRLEAYYYYHSDPTGEEGNGNYIVSQPFTLSGANLHFESVPPTVVYIDPVELKFLVNWKLNFYPPTVLIEHYDAEGEWTGVWRELVSTSNDFTYRISVEDADMAGSYSLNAFYYYEKLSVEPNEGVPYTGYWVEFDSFKLSTDNLQFTEAPILFDTEAGQPIIRWETNFVPTQVKIFHLDTSGDTVIDAVTNTGTDTVGYWIFGYEDAPEYIVGTDYYVLAFYGSRECDYICEELSDSYGFKTSPEDGQYADGLAAYTMNWTTNFTPRKVTVVRDGATVKTFTDGMSRTMSKDLPATAGEGAFQLRAWYGSGDEEFVTSDPFQVTYSGPMFTKQPQDGPVLDNSYYEAHWSTSFTPLRLELWTYKDGEHEKVPGELVPTATAFAFTYDKAMEYLDKVFYLRAWYGEGEDEYRNSFNFKVTPRIQLGTSAVDLGVSAFVLPTEEGENYYTIYNNNYTDTSYLNYTFVTGGNRTIEVILEATNDYSVGDMYIPEYSKYALRYVLQGYTDENGIGHQDEEYKAGFQNDPVFFGIKPGNIHFSISMAELRRQFAATGNPNPEVMNLHISVSFSGENYSDNYDWWIMDYHQTEPEFWFYPEIDYENLTLTSKSFVPELEFLSAENHPELENVDLPQITGIKTDWYTVLVTNASVKDDDGNIFYGRDPYPEDPSEDDSWLSYIYSFPEDPIDELFARYFGNGYNDWVNGPVNPAAAYGLGPANYKFGLAANHITVIADTVEETGVSLSRFISADNLEFFNSLVGLNSSPDWGYFTEYLDNMPDNMPFYELVGMINCVITITYNDGAVYRKDLAFTQGGESYGFEIHGEQYKLPEFKLQSLVLSGEIGVNFYLDLSTLSEEEREASYVEFEVSSNDNKITDTFDPNCKVTESSDIYYGFTCHINALQMADEIKAVFHYEKDGITRTIEKTYSALQFIQKVEDMVSEDPSSYPQKAYELVKAIADYGYYAQHFLATANGLTLGEGGRYTEMTKHYTDSYDYDDIKNQVENYALTVGGVTSGLARVTYTLRFDSQTAFEIFFTPKADVQFEATASFNNRTYQAVLQEDGRYLIRISDIAAHQLAGNKYKIHIEGDADGAFTIDAYALSYVNVVLSSSTDELQKKAMSAFYCYYEKAMAFRGD